VKRSGKSALGLKALEESKASYAYAGFDNENPYDPTVKGLANKYPN